MSNFLSGLLDNPFFTAIGLLIAPWLAIPALIIKHWDKIAGFFTDLWENILQPIFQGVADFFGGIAEFVGGVAGGVADAFTAPAFPEKEAPNKEAPNTIEAESKSFMDFRGKLNISGAPEGSNFEQNKESKSSIDVTLLGENP